MLSYYSNQYFMESTFSNYVLLCIGALVAL